MAHIDVTPVRAEWDQMMRAFELDTNRGHFKQSYEYDPAILEAGPSTQGGISGFFGLVDYGRILPVVCCTKKSKKM